MKDKIDIKGIGFEELKRLMNENGVQPFRAQQVFHWVYQKNSNSFQDMINLPKELIELLDSRFTLIKIKSLKIQKSRDGSEKYLFQLPDSEYIETVLIKNKNRNTLCISSQAGCRWNCLFCASGKMGFKRNLLTGEIIEQISSVRRITGENIQNIVFMGMGEPFNNYKNVRVPLLEEYLDVCIGYGMVPVIEIKSVITITYINVCKFRFYSLF